MLEFVNEFVIMLSKLTLLITQNFPVKYKLKKEAYLEVYRMWLYSFVLRVNFL